MESLRNDVFLQGFDTDKPIRMDTDASDVAYGNVLMQQDGSRMWQPFLMAHHKFKEGKTGWDMPDKELYAIVYHHQ